MQCKDSIGNEISEKNISVPMWHRNLLVNLVVFALKRDYYITFVVQLVFGRQRYFGGDLRFGLGRAFGFEKCNSFGAQPRRRLGIKIAHTGLDSYSLGVVVFAICGNVIARNFATGKFFSLLVNVLTGCRHRAGVAIDFGRIFETHLGA